MASLSRSLLRLGHSLCLKGKISQADKHGRSATSALQRLPANFPLKRLSCHWRASPPACIAFCKSKLKLSPITNVLMVLGSGSPTCLRTACTRDNIADALQDSAIRNWAACVLKQYAKYASSGLASPFLVAISGTLFLMVLSRPRWLARSQLCFG